MPSHVSGKRRLVIVDEPRGGGRAPSQQAPYSQVPTSSVPYTYVQYPPNPNPAAAYYPHYPQPQPSFSPGYPPHSGAPLAPERHTQVHASSWATPVAPPPLAPSVPYASEQAYQQPLPSRNVVLRAPMGQAHAAYSGRTESLGYGRSAAPRSSSLSRNFPLKQKDLDRLDEIKKYSEGARLVQPIRQGSDPDLDGGPYADGICSGMAAEWLRLHASLPSESASRAFGDALNNDKQRVMGHQRRADDYKRILISDSRLSSREAARLEDKMALEESGGLRATFTRKGRLYPGEEGETSSLREIGQHIKDGGDGLYLLHFSNYETHEAHAITLQISSARNEFKLMDPNTGEYSTTSREGFGQLLMNSLHYEYYNDDFNRFSIRHFDLP